jgi:hypothetical protein
MVRVKPLTAAVATNAAIIVAVGDLMDDRDPVVKANRAYFRPARTYLTVNVSSVRVWFPPNSMASTSTL